jgi:biotin carboxylase
VVAHQLPSNRVICGDFWLYGAANIQCIKRGEKYFFTEINPRFSAGGLPLTIEAGANTPYLLVKMVLGQKIKPISDFTDHLIMMRYFSETFVFLNDLPDYSPNI